MKKFLLVFTTLLVITGCGSKGDKKTDSSNDLTKVTIFAMQNGKGLDPQAPVTAEILKNTNIELTNVASKNQTDEQQAYNLMLTSTKLPDLISYQSIPDLENLGVEGGVIPLQDLVKKYAPDIEAFWEKYPRFKKDATAADGNIYIIPSYYDWYNLRTSKGYFIRKDWLKKLGLKEPKTVEQLHKALLAFKNNDPNGNGKKDEVPLFIRAWVDSDIVFTLVDIFKATSTFVEKDNKIIFGGDQNSYKVAIENLAKWYKEGLIDKEVFTRKGSSRDFMLSNNIGGFTSDWIGSTSGYNSKLTIPGFDFSIILPPEFNGNNKTRNSRPDYEGGVAISKDAKDPEKLIKFLNFFYTKKGRDLYNFGREGEEYTIVDGEPVFTDKVMKDKDGRTALQVLRSLGVQVRLGAAQDYKYELAWSTPEAKKGLSLYMESDVIDEGIPPLKFTANELQVLVPITTQINTYLNQKTQQWILGSSDVNKDWKSYKERLNELGLPKALKIYNDAYNRYINSK